MPRPLVFSNGRLLVALDDRYRIRDLFFPHVGLFNHLSGHSIRMGVWADGQLSWVDDDTWQRKLRYKPGTLVGESSLSNSGLKLELHIEEGISSQPDAYRRHIRVTNLAETAREIKLFFTHDLRLAETDIGDTAFFNPFLNGVIHYKGPHWLYFAARGQAKGIAEYATGTKGFKGMEGTWRDAEDGKLSMNPIAQGSVDSTFSIVLQLEPGGEAAASYEIVAAESLLTLEDALGKVSETHIHQIAGRHADETRHLEELLSGLPSDVVEVARRSQLVLESLCDEGGAIVAAIDSDIMETARANYCYCWPRDGAHVATVLDRLGRHELSRRFFRFCARAVSDRHPMLLQKYRPDGTLGASWHPWVVDEEPEVPFQADESASVLLALNEHFRRTQDFGLLDELYDRMVRPMAWFLANHRDPSTGLPKPSYDLWEERRGIHTYTCASIFAGLHAAADLAAHRQDPASEEFRAAAEGVRNAILSQLGKSSRGGFLRRLEVEPGGNQIPDETFDASTLWVGLFGAIDPNDAFFEIHMRNVWDALWVATPIGGLARYSGDYYFRVNQETPGNPWIITTLWLAQCLIARASTEEDLVEPMEMMRWAAHFAGPTQILPEQLHPLSGAPLSVSPLTWSHAEFLKAALDWAEKKQALTAVPVESYG